MTEVGARKVSIQKPTEFLSLPCTSRIWESASTKSPNTYLRITDGLSDITRLSTPGYTAGWSTTGGWVLYNATCIGANNF